MGPVVYFGDTYVISCRVPLKRITHIHMTPNVYPKTELHLFIQYLEADVMKISLYDHRRVINIEVSQSVTSL